MNNKQKTRTIIYSFISILIIGVLIAFFGGQKTSFPECSGGLQVASIDNIEVNDETAIIITGHLNNGGECLKVVYKKEKLNSLLEKYGLIANNDLVIDIKASNAREAFYYNPSQDTYSLLNYKDTKMKLIDSCTTNFCSNNQISSFYQHVSGSLFAPVCKCFYEETSEIRRTTRQLTSKFFVDITASDSKSSGSKSVDGDIKGNSIVYGKEAPQLLIGNDIIVYLSGLLPSTLLSKTPDYDAIIINGNLRLVSDDVSGDYSVLKQDYKNRISKGIITRADEKINLVNDFNNLLKTNLLSDKKIEFEQTNQEIVLKSDYVDNSLMVYYKNLIMSPVVKIQVLNAESVGIIQLKSQPRIVCAPEQKTISGAGKTFSVKIFNDGKVPSSFDFSYQCNDFSIKSADRTNIIQPGSFEEFSISFSGSGDTKGKCTLVASSPVDKRISSSCSQSFVSEKKACFENELLCSDDYKSILECSNGKFVVKEQCGRFCEIIDNAPVCVQTTKKEQCTNKIDDDNDELIDCDDNDCIKDKACNKDVCAWYDVPCQLNQWLAPLKMIMLIVLPLVSLIIVFGMGQDKFKLDKTKSLLLGLVVAGGVLGLVYFYFWAGLILGLLLLILKILL